MLKKKQIVGFTLIEILVVIFIISTLTTILVVAIGGFAGRTYDESCKALIRRIEQAMMVYYNEFGKYPPDGFDHPVYAEDSRGNDVRIYGSQCLIHFLAWRRNKDDNSEFILYRWQAVPMSDQRRKVQANNGRPYLVLDDNEFSQGEFADILDPWGLPLHYDNIEDGVSWQDSRDGKYHMSAGAAGYFEHCHSEVGDPRRGRTLARTYDIWSHGSDLTDKQGYILRSDLQR